MKWPFGKKETQTSTYVIEDIFEINSKGCVVVGTIQGTFVVGKKVTITCQDGKQIKTTLNAIEVNRQQPKSASNTPAGLLFKDVEPDSIRKGDTISCES